MAGQRSLLAPRTTGTTFSGSTTNLSASGCPTNRRRTKQLIYVINPARSCLAWLVPPFSLCFLSDAPHDPISLLHLPSIYRPIYTHPSHLSRLVSLLSCCVSTYYLRQESLALLSPHLTLVATVYLYSVTLHVSIYTSPFVHGLQKATQVSSCSITSPQSNPKYFPSLRVSSMYSLALTYHSQRRSEGLSFRSQG